METRARRTGLVASKVLVLALACAWPATGLSAQAMTMSIIYVDAETGDDANPGTARNPVQTLNEALARAWALKNEPVPQGAKIKVFASDTSIAPDLYGGHETVAWYDPLEPAFPIRMIDGVDIVGVPDPVTGDRPRIEIDEGGSPPYTYGQAGRAFVLGASNCVLQEFDIDGTNLMDASMVWGVIARDVLNFDLQDCDVLEQHDGVRYFASEGAVCSGTVTKCTLSDFYPLDWTGAEELKEEGHAGLWLEGQDGGTVSVTVIDTDFYDSHDAIEIAGPDPGSQFSANLTVLGGEIVGNENGIEIVGKGTLEAYISGVKFIDNYNGRPGGNGATGNSYPISCVAVSGMTVKACIRGCDFENFSVGVLFSPFKESMDSCLDMGRDMMDPVCCTGDLPGDSPGGNTFVLPSTWTPANEPFKVAVWNRYNPNGIPDDWFIRASQNMWLPDNQGADPNGCYTLGDYSPATELNPPPYTLGSGQDRNYAILVPGTGIDFGTSCPPP